MTKIQPRGNKYQHMTFLSQRKQWTAKALPDCLWIKI